MKAKGDAFAISFHEKTHTHTHSHTHTHTHTHLQPVPSGLIREDRIWPHLWPRDPRKCFKRQTKVHLWKTRTREGFWFFRRMPEQNPVERFLAFIFGLDLNNKRYFFPRFTRIKGNLSPVCWSGGFPSCVVTPPSASCTRTLFARSRAAGHKADAQGGAREEERRGRRGLTASSWSAAKCTDPMGALRLRTCSNQLAGATCLTHRHLARSEEWSVCVCVCRGGGGLNNVPLTWVYKKNEGKKSVKETTAKGGNVYSLQMNEWIDRPPPPPPPPHTHTHKHTQTHTHPSLTPPPDVCVCCRW